MLASWLVRTPRLALLLLPSLAACATARPPTLNLRSFLGATEDGGYAFSEIHSSPGTSPRGLTYEVSPDGRVLQERALPTELVEKALGAAVKAGPSPTRTADASLEALAVEGYDRSRVVTVSLPAAAPAFIVLVIASATGAKLTLATDPATGDLRVLLKLEAGEHELTLGRIAMPPGTFRGGLLLLPGERKALLLVGNATTSRAGIFRTETFSELDLGGGAATLLDAQAVEELQRHDVASALHDLKRAAIASPRDSTVHYNLACAYALSGDEDKALLALGRAVDLDPERLRAFARQDGDLASLHGRPEFILMVEPRPGDN